MKPKMPQSHLFGFCTDHAASWFWNRSFIIVTVSIEYRLISVGFYWLVNASEAVFAELPMYCRSFVSSWEKKNNDLLKYTFGKSMQTYLQFPQESFTWFMKNPGFFIHGSWSLLQGGIGKHIILFRVLYPCHEGSIWEPYELKSLAGSLEFRTKWVSKVHQNLGNQQYICCSKYWTNVGLAMRAAEPVFSDHLMRFIHKSLAGHVHAENKGEHGR